MRRSPCRRDKSNSCICFTALGGISISFKDPRTSTREYVCEGKLRNRKHWNYYHKPLEIKCKVVCVCAFVQSLGKVSIAFIRLSERSEIPKQLRIVINVKNIQF